MNVAPFVIDIGTNFIKHELSGSDAPNLLRTEVGLEKYSRTSSSSSSSAHIDYQNNKNRKLIIGKELDALRSVTEIIRPIEHGNIFCNNNNNNNNNNKTFVETLLRHSIVDCAKITPSEHAILLTEAVQTSDSQRKALAEFFFEDLHASSLMFGVQPVLSLHATGKTTGLVLECGAGVTQTCAVYDGYTIRDACARRDFGGNDVTDSLKRFLREDVSPDELANGFSSSISSNGDWETLQDMKHKLCKINSSLVVVDNNNDGKNKNQKEASTGGKKSKTNNNFKLPDGSELEIPETTTQDRISEIFFSSSSSINNNLQEVVVRETLKKCDVSIRSKLCESVHLSGGTTLMTNFAERFAREMAQLVPSSSKVRVHASNGRENAAWFGGSLVSQLSTSVSQFGVSRSQYLEEGEGALLKKKLIG